MDRLYRYPDDFEAVVRILTEQEGGRKLPPFNGIRWDLRYFHQREDSNWMVWPEFLDESGRMIPLDRPVTGFVKARFYVINKDLIDYHRREARVGGGFFCVEGARVCAAGVITRITGLVEPGLSEPMGET